MEIKRAWRKEAVVKMGLQGFSVSKVISLN
jgi:hypothetical protein